MVLIFLFWVAIAAIVIAFVWGWAARWNDFFDGLVAAGGTLLISAIVLLIYLAVVTFPTTYHPVSYSEQTYKIQALDTGSDVTGRRYLFSGYIDEKPVISYIRDNGEGGLLIKRVDADDSVVYEGDYRPEIKVTTTEYGNPFWHPYTAERESFSFYVPEGSVSTEVAVTP